jgi:hypothetical protein
MISVLNIAIVTDAKITGLKIINSIQNDLVE